MPSLRLTYNMKMALWRDKSFISTSAARSCCADSIDNPTATPLGHWEMRPLLRLVHWGHVEMTRV